MSARPVGSVVRATPPPRPSKPTFSGANPNVQNAIGSGSSSNLNHSSDVNKTHNNANHTTVTNHPPNKITPRLRSATSPKLPSHTSKREPIPVFTVNPPPAPLLHQTSVAGSDMSSIYSAPSNIIPQTPQLNVSNPNLPRYNQSAFNLIKNNDVGNNNHSNVVDHNHLNEQPRQTPSRPGSTISVISSIYSSPSNIIPQTPQVNAPHNSISPNPPPRRSGSDITPSPNNLGPYNNNTNFSSSPEPPHPPPRSRTSTNNPNLTPMEADLGPSFGDCLHILVLAMWPSTGLEGGVPLVENRAGSVGVPGLGATGTTGTNLQSSEHNKGLPFYHVTGEACLNWMCKDFGVASRDKAMLLAQKLVDAGYLRTHEMKPFSDSPDAIYELHCIPFKTKDPSATPSIDKTKKIFSSFKVPGKRESSSNYSPVSNPKMPNNVSSPIPIMTAIPNNLNLSSGGNAVNNVMNSSGGSNGSGGAGNSGSVINNNPVGNSNNTVNTETEAIWGEKRNADSVKYSLDKEKSREKDKEKSSRSKKDWAKMKSKIQKITASMRKEDEEAADKSDTISINLIGDKKWEIELAEDSETMLFSPSTDGSCPKVKAGTVDKLIEWLIHGQYTDLNFRDTFLLVYKSFITPIALFESIKTSFIMEADPNSAIRVKVIAVLRRWIETQWDSDFRDDQPLRFSLNEFVNHSIVPVYPAAGSQLVRAIHTSSSRKRSSIYDSDYINKKITQTGSFPAIPQSSRQQEKLRLIANFGSGQNWELLDDETLAQHMTMIDFEIFRSIEPAELLDKNWTKGYPKADLKSPHVMRMITRFNLISRWMIEQILKPISPEKRAAIITKLIRVGGMFLELKNFNGVMQIISALHSAPIRRLEQTWDCLRGVGPMGRTMVENFERLESVLEHTGGFKAYRATLSKSDPPCLPYLGVHLTDLMFVEEGNKEWVQVKKMDENPAAFPSFEPCNDIKLLNWFKKNKVAEIIRELGLYQQVDYEFEVDPSIRDWLFALGEDKDNKLRQQPNSRSSSEKWYQISLRVEPKKGEVSESYVKLLMEEERMREKIKELEVKVGRLEQEKKELEWANQGLVDDLKMVHRVSLGMNVMGGPRTQDIDNSVEGVVQQGGEPGFVGGNGGNMARSGGINGLGRGIGRGRGGAGPNMSLPQITDVKANLRKGKERV